ncbi:hypothetical protein EAE99_004320 [Botrytis elliptica]|nr:hypothetical protein EAE99_004320 [Botrytis elliptica]
MEPSNFIPDETPPAVLDTDSGNASSEGHDEMISVQKNQDIGDKTPAYVQNGMSDFVPREQHQQVLEKLQAFEQKLAFMDGFMQRISQEKQSSLSHDTKDIDYSSDSDSDTDREYRKMYLRDLYEMTMKKKMLRKLRREKQDALIGNRSDEETARVKNAPTSDVETEEKLLISQLVMKGEALTPKYMDWKSFSDLRKGQDSILHPIQVLVGEPEVGIGFKKDVVLPNESDVTMKQSQETKAIAKKDNLGVQDPLPERIKIVSKSLFEDLSFISDSFASMDYTDVGITILRPYKILLHCETKIRDRLAKLEENQSSKKDERKTCSPQNDDETISASQTDILQPENTQPTSKQDDHILGEGEGVDNNDIREALQLRCVLNFIDTKIQPKLKLLNGNTFQDISFNDLWHLYKPGDEVIDQAERQAFRVIRVETPVHDSTRFYKDSDEQSSEKSFQIYCVYIDFDGKFLGPVSVDFSISRYDGEKPIRSLPIFPFRFARQKIDRDQLIERGRMLLDITTVKSMYYMGMTVDTKDEVDSQVVIDFNVALAEEDRKHWAPYIELVIKTVDKSTSTQEQNCQALCCRHQMVYEDAQVDRYRAEDFVQSLLPETSSQHPSLIIYARPLQEVISGGNEPSKDELAIMTFRVFGFVLRTRKWAKLDLKYLRYENEANNKTVQTAFERLVLPEGHKDVVQALVTQHFRDKKTSSVRDEQYDLVRGKGKGLIILLHGAPGVGKTTTAEGVAESFKRPLFQITCGDLGTTAHEVVKELERNFALASRWGCVLLLDEADVFLAQRERKDFIRNGLVAAFLRVLEYHAGILFLTTNRVGDFDEAFASRIHMSLYYPELNREQTEKVFKLNLELIESRFRAQNRELEFDDSAVLSFAKQHYDEHKHARWNGRQIRNASQTALALAEFDALNKSLALEIDNSTKVHLKQGHFTTVQKAYLAFAKYLGEVFGTEGDKRAEENQLRAREELNRTSKGHQKENSESKYRETEFQPTNQHTNVMYQGNGYLPPRGPSPYQQMGHGPARGGSFGGAQQETYSYNQPTRLTPSNTPYNQPSIVHESHGGQQHPNQYSQQGWQQTAPQTTPGQINAIPRQMPIPVTQSHQAMYNQSYPQAQDGAHAQIPSRGSEYSEFQER